MDGALWSPEAWSVYGMSVRTNNDTEGWHRCVNTTVRANQHLYGPATLGEASAHSSPAVEGQEAEEVPMLDVQEYAGVAIQTLGSV